MRTQRPEGLRAPPATEEARPPAEGHGHSLVLGQTGIPGLGTLTATLEKHMCASQIRPQCDSLSSDDTLTLRRKESPLLFHSGGQHWMNSQPQFFTRFLVWFNICLLRWTKKKIILHTTGWTCAAEGFGSMKSSRCGGQMHTVPQLNSGNESAQRIEFSVPHLSTPENTD